MERRPVRARNNDAIRALASKLASKGVNPNAISGASVVISAGAFGALACAPRTDVGRGVALYLLAALCIGLRGLCNVVDGLVAVEGGRASPTGAVWNDLPDRLSDALMLLGAGYSITWVTWGPELGWAAALLATVTAYVRLLGGASGLPQKFEGPMAKPQRMAVIALACFAACVEIIAGLHTRAMVVALAVVIIGTLATIVRRTARILRLLAERGGQ